MNDRQQQQQPSEPQQSHVSLQDRLFKQLNRRQSESSPTTTQSHSSGFATRDVPIPTQSLPSHQFTRLTANYKPTHASSESQLSWLEERESLHAQAITELQQEAQINRQVIQQQQKVLEI